ncbi:MAG: hypothetical protein KatS3mg105_0335 [Gemmatales bacterium]|nr:MAG: hypothetical protein KatS3mg105_0335 [Gemmatales bacterium]
MLLCSECGAEMEGEGFCPGCGLYIQEPIPAAAPADAYATAQEVGTPGVSQVVLTTCQNEQEAQQLQQKLAAAGIFVVLQEQEEQSADWFSPSGDEAASVKVAVLVSVDDFDRATRVLTESAAEPAENQMFATGVEEAPQTPFGNMPEEAAGSASAVAEVEQPSSSDESPIGEAEPGVQQPPPVPEEQTPAMISLPPGETLRSLESKLSALMDEHDTPGWTVNPAFHPEVNAFIERYAHYAAFVKRARFLQQNRSKYYATMREKNKETAAVPVETVATDAVDTDSDWAVAGPTIPIYRDAGSRRRRWIALAIACVLVTLVAGGVGYVRYAALQALDAAMERISRNESNWRWAELRESEKSDQTAKDGGKDAARLLQQASEALPADWPEEQETKIQAILARPLGEPLKIEDINFISQLLQQFSEVLPKVLAVSKAPARRLPLGEFSDTLQPREELKKLRRLMELLALYSTQQLYAGRADDALTTITAMVHVARVFGDNPDPDVQLLRIDVRNLACRQLEQVLARGSVSVRMLKSAQSAFAEEAKQPVLSAIMRGRRAWIHEVLTRLQNRDAEIANRLPDDLLSLADRWLKLPKHHAELLDSMTRTVAIAKLKGRQRLEQMYLHEKGLRQPHVQRLQELADAFSRRWVRDAKGLAIREMISQTRLNCAATALAVAQFHDSQKRWPETLKELVQQKLLATIPEDPFDGKQLRYRLDKTVLVVYSVGPDEKDDKGILAYGDEKTDGKDIGFRLIIDAATPATPPKTELERVVDAIYEQVVGKKTNDPAP